jgi:hypothetical protein
LVVSTGTPPTQIGTYRAQSRNLRLLALTRQSDALPAPKSIDQNQGLLIWRADLAENKEAKFYRHGGSGGAEDAAKAEFFGFRR